MNKRLRSELQSKLENQPDLQISEEHLAQTMRQARIAYQSRQSCQSREPIRYPAFLLRQIRFVGASVWFSQGLLLLCAFLLFGFTDIGDIPGTNLRHLPVLLGCFAVFVAMTSIFLLGVQCGIKCLKQKW